MLNPYFLQGSKSEQGLIQDLINEQLKMYGIEVYYIPRQYITKRRIIKEVIESEFNHAYPIEAYVDTFDGYEGAGTLMTKFGIQPMDDLTLIISRERYEMYIAPLIANVPNIELSSRPKEGDLIYFPLGDRLFEIKYIEHENPFYQLQKTYVYNLKCELFRYGDELIDTGVVFIDDNVERQGYSETFNMIGAGITATASATIVNGGVRLVTLTNRGDGYKTTPQVKFGSPISGVTATGIATMIGGIVDLCEPDSTLLRVQGVELTNSGYGYTVAPTVAFYGGSGTGAEAYATIGDGIVGTITVNSGGSGYATEPIVSFVGISSVSASARVTLVNGTITTINVINSGLGYTVAPQIIIDSPYMIGIGTYQYNETVTGGISSHTARVKSWDAGTNQLELSNITGQFYPGEILVGGVSNATYKIRVVNDNITNDSFAENADIQTEANTILDFTQSNPFGSP